MPLSKTYAWPHIGRKWTLPQLRPEADTWRLECVAIGASIMSLTTIVILLARYDGTPILEWHGITLNATVSSLSTVVRGMLLLSVGSCLSQFKWIWFNKRLQPLPDFEKINEAARGPLGSLRLLVHTRLR